MEAIGGNLTKIFNYALATINVAEIFMQLMIICCVLCLLLVLVWFLTGFPCHPFEMIRRSE